MSNSKSKCKYCKEYVRDAKTYPSGTFCNIEHAAAWANEKAVKKREAAANKEKKVARAKHKKDKERIKTRKQWLDQLQRLVNQWVVHVRDVGQPCITCGKTSDVKYDAGHYRSRGACPELRFEPTNIHKQCSVNCNQHGSGMRAEYRVAIIAKYGQGHLEWLDGPHMKLKYQLPHYTDIKEEMARYRALIREAGLTPYA